VTAASSSALAPTAAHGRRATTPNRSAAPNPGSTSAIVAGAPSMETPNAELASSREECTAPPYPAAQTSTTTGSTIGRLRSRS
jgi:hypothetical protein